VLRRGGEEGGEERREEREGIISMNVI